MQLPLEPQRLYTTFQHIVKKAQCASSAPQNLETDLMAEHTVRRKSRTTLASIPYVTLVLLKIILSSQGSVLPILLGWLKQTLTCSCALISDFGQIKF